jgi:uroporphyrin-III C-methyltransferase/precorrin-2 dehydrogenase/sirohydrochlorin ferrochelatase
MDYLPVSLLLRDRKVVLVGAGVVAARKARFLLGAGARLTVIAPRRDASFEACVAGADVHWEARPWRDGDLAGASLAVAATPDPRSTRPCTGRPRRACHSRQRGRHAIPVHLHLSGDR